MSAPEPAPVGSLPGTGAVGCVVVHHRNFPVVLRTVDSILASGVSALDLVVVDNSGDGEEERLRAALPPGAHLLVVPNRGYAAAVNAGFRVLAGRPRTPRYVLVATHEVLLADGCLAELRAELETSGAQAAGPTLLTRDASGARTVWSMGGELSPWLNLPRHVRSAGASGHAPGAGGVSRQWLDGAAVLYTADALAEGLREDFVLYVEETELHQRLRRAGALVRWVPGAVAYQESRGIPPYLLARNLQLFQRAHGGPLARTFAVPYAAARCALVAAVRRRPVPVAPLVRGWWAGLSARPATPAAPTDDLVVDGVLAQIRRP